MFTLRPYQGAAVEAGLRSLRGAAGAGLLVEPMGAGKSLIIANIVKELGEPVVVFQPSKELVEQNASKLVSYGYEPAIYSASLNEKRVGDITLATIGSVKDPKVFEGVNHVIFDEADLVSPKKGMYLDFIKGAGSMRVLGLTATPFRMSRDGYGGIMLKFLTRTRPKVFTDVAHYTQIGDLVKQGFLSGMVYHEVTSINEQKLKLNTTGADYTDESVMRHFDDIGMRARVVRVVNRLLDRGRKRILVFTKFVDDAESLMASVPGTAVVSGDTPKREREMIIGDFRAGLVPIVANVGVLATGFDYPELDTVVLARPTMSLRLYMQMVGRVMRTAPTKTDAWVVDMANLVKKFGRVEDIRMVAGGHSGDQWKFVTGAGKALTNQYLGGKPKRWNRSEQVPW